MLLEAGKAHYSAPCKGYRLKQLFLELPDLIQLTDSNRCVVVEGKSAALLSCSPNKRTAPTVSAFHLFPDGFYMVVNNQSIFIVTNLNNTGFQRPNSYITIYHKLKYSLIIMAYLIYNP